MEHTTEPVLGRHPGTVNISNSEIQTFKDCRRKWWLGNYRGLQPKQENFVGPLPLGIRVHNALETHYRDGVDIVEEYVRLQKLDNDRFINSPDGTDTAAMKKFNSESELGRIMVEGYAEWVDETNADAKIEIEGAEIKLSHNLESNPRVNIIGKVDLVARRRSDGSLAVFDHKTTKSIDDYYRHSHASEQLMTYTNLLIREAVFAGQKVDGGEYNLLKKVKRTGTAKPPFYDRISVRFNKKQLASQWMRLEGIVSDMMNVRDALDNGADHRVVAYPRPRMDWGCTKTGCPFADICTWFDDGSAAEDYLADHFVQGDPNARYADDEDED